MGIGLDYPIFLVDGDTSWIDAEDLSEGEYDVVTISQHGVTEFSRVSREKALERVRDFYDSSGQGANIPAICGRHS